MTLYQLVFMNFCQIRNEIQQWPRLQDKAILGSLDSAATMDILPDGAFQVNVGKMFINFYEFYLGRDTLVVTWWYTLSVAAEVGTKSGSQDQPGFSLFSHDPKRIQFTTYDTESLTGQFLKATQVIGHTDRPRHSACWCSVVPYVTLKGILRGMAMDHLPKCFAEPKFVGNVSWAALNCWEQLPLIFLEVWLDKVSQMHY